MVTRLSRHGFAEWVRTAHPLLSNLEDDQCQYALWLAILIEAVDVETDAFLDGSSPLIMEEQCFSTWTDHQKVSFLNSCVKKCIGNLKTQESVFALDYVESCAVTSAIRYLVGLSLETFHDTVSGAEEIGHAELLLGLIIEDVPINAMIRYFGSRHHDPRYKCYDETFSAEAIISDRFSVEDELRSLGRDSFERVEAAWDEYDLWHKRAPGQPYREEIRSGICSGLRRPLRFDQRRKIVKERQKKNRCKRLYLMKCERNGFYKIGVSVNPRFREKTLASEDPSVRLVGHWPKLSSWERVWHSYFSAHRVRGEWFHLTPAQVRLFCKRCVAGSGPPSKPVTNLHLTQ